MKFYDVEVGDYVVKSKEDPSSLQEALDSLLVIGKLLNYEVTVMKFNGVREIHIFKPIRFPNSTSMIIKIKVSGDVIQSYEIVSNCEGRKVYTLLKDMANSVNHLIEKM